jgi:hypothetical protein
MGLEFSRSVGYVWSSGHGFSMAEIWALGLVKSKCRFETSSQELGDTSFFLLHQPDDVILSYALQIEFV